MNKHGQTLILFVILIPIIIMLLAIIVDIGLVMGNKIKLEEVTKNAVQDAFNDDNKILEILKKNEVDTSNIKITRENDKLKVEIKQEVKSIFGGIVGIKKYDIKVNIVSFVENDKVIFE